MLIHNVCRYIHIHRVRRAAAFVLLLLVSSSLIAACVTVSPSAPAKQHDAAIPAAWFRLALQLVQETEGFSPPVASRAFGYLGVTLYETVQPGMPGYRTLAGQLNELEALPRFPPLGEYHWSVAANSALAHMMRYLFITAGEVNLAAIDDLEQRLSEQLLAEAEVDTTTHQRSVIWGRLMANAIYAWSREDGGHDGHTTNYPVSYASPIGEGLWVSTPPAFAGAMHPQWGHNRPFALAFGAECPAEPPPAYSENPTSEFYTQALEVYQTVQVLTEEQRTIALFWADDPGHTATPPGHWISILTQVLAERNESLDVAAESYARVGMALADAFITCWSTKYRYNLIRPISYIQQVIDPTWNMPGVTDPVVTPPFPEYTSGHSVQSAAAAYVLTDLFGDNVAFVDSIHEARGLPPRTYTSFFHAAEEAAVSRLYGGIHYRAAIENGLAQGTCVGKKIGALQFKE